VVRWPWVSRRHFHAVCGSRDTALAHLAEAMPAVAARDETLTYIRDKRAEILTQPYPSTEALAQSVAVHEVLTTVEYLLSGRAQRDRGQV